MQMITETASYTTTLNPADALMATFDLMKGESNVVWSPSRRLDNFYPHVLLLVQNVDLGSNLIFEVTGDTIAGDFAAHIDGVRWFIKKIQGTAGAVDQTLATATSTYYHIEGDTSDSAENHVYAMPPRIHVWGSATAAAAKTVNITCYMSG